MFENSFNPRIEPILGENTPNPRYEIPDIIDESQPNPEEVLIKKEDSESDVVTPEYGGEYIDNEHNDAYSQIAERYEMSGMLSQQELATSEIIREQGLEEYYNNIEPRLPFEMNSDDKPSHYENLAEQHRIPTDPRDTKAARIQYDLDMEQREQHPLKRTDTHKEIDRTSIRGRESL